MIARSGPDRAPNPVPGPSAAPPILEAMQNGPSPGRSASACSPSWSTSVRRRAAPRPRRGAAERRRRGQRAGHEPHQADPHRVDGAHACSTRCAARRSTTPAAGALQRDPRAVARTSSRASSRPTSSRSSSEVVAAVHQRRRRRESELRHRAGAARRLARRPVPRHPGHAVHPAGAGAAAARARCAGARSTRARRARRPAGPSGVPVSRGRCADDRRRRAVPTCSRGRPTVWRARPAEQQPEWPDAGALDAALAELRDAAAARVRRRGAHR